MIERLYKRALEAELAFLAQEPKRLEMFLKMQNDLSDKEVEGVRTYFLANRANVTINYPRQKDPKFPLYTIILAEEREIQPFLGDTLGVLNVEDVTDLDIRALAGSEMIGYLQHNRHHIQVMTEESPDLTLYYYQIAKAAIFRRANALKRAGLHTLRFSGRDFFPDPTYAPTHIFVRQFTIESESLFSIIGDIPDDYFSEIDGIYIQDEPPIGGITANVNVTNIFEDETEE